MQRAGDQRTRKRLDRDVEIAHRAVVVAARHLQLIFDVGQLVLQFEKVLVGLELRVGLRQRKQPAERGLQGAGRCRLPVHVAGRDARGAGSGHLFEHPALVRRVGLDGLDQIGNEVGAPAQLDVDPAESLAHHVTQPNQPVVDHDRIDRDRNDDRKNDPFH